MKYFKKIRHFAQLTLPIETSVRIPQNDISRYVNEIVETIPDSEFDEFRHHRGATSYHPKMMLKIILYAYTKSVFSGRRIEKLLHDSIRMMWLAQNQTPSYKTINRFRVNPNTDALIESLFIQFHSQCLKQNLIDDNSIFIDGTKVEASAIGFVLMALNIRKIAAQRAVHYKIHIKKADFYQIINRNQLFYIA